MIHHAGCNLAVVGKSSMELLTGEEAGMDVTVKTRYGSLCGNHKDGYMEFLGVPFAKPPVGELRFKKPQKMEPWKGVRETKCYKDYCPQPGKVDTMVDYTKPNEDCLYLNIYTPACDEKRRPVLIWIHGGAYLTGTNSSISKRGDLLAKHFDVVVVALQYRLGGFGQVDFASLSGSRGLFDTNCGAWDQLAGIDWVIENIESFGGNPQCITLEGESAGACSVLSMITTPYLKGKIRRAIMEGPAPFIFNTKENGRLAALDVAKRLRLAEEEAWKIQNMDGDRLTKAVYESECNFRHIRPYLIPTAPVIDGDLLPESPFDAVMHGAVDGMEILLGTTKDEGSIFAMKSKEDLFPATKAEMDKFFRESPAVNKGAILSLYRGKTEKKIGREMGKEIFFHLPTMAIAEKLAQSNKVYMYYFTYVLPVFRLLGVGSVHCTNSAMVFGGELSGDLKLYGLGSGRNGKKIKVMIHESWGNFVATGNPGMNWTEYGGDKQMMVLDINSRMQTETFEGVKKAYGLIRPYGN